MRAGNNDREFPLTGTNFYNQPVLSGIYTSVTCTSLRLTLLLRDRTLQLLIRGAKSWLDLLRSRIDSFNKRLDVDAEDFAGWLQLLVICQYRYPMAHGFR